MNTNQTSQHNKKHHHMRIIGIASGKGGVGKSQIALNLSIALAMQKQRVVLFDGDFGLGNITTMLGISKPKMALEQVINNEVTLKDTLIQGPKGIRIIPAASGVAGLLNMTTQDAFQVWRQLESIDHFVDYVIIDLAAGLSDVSTKLLLSSDQMLIVLTPSITSIVDAYGVIKILSDYKTDKINYFVNRYHNDQEHSVVATKIKTVAKNYLGLNINNLGGLQNDWRVEKSLMKQNPFVLGFPKARISHSMSALGNCLIKQNMTSMNFKDRLDVWH